MSRRQRRSGTPDHPIPAIPSQRGTGIADQRGLADESQVIDSQPERSPALSAPSEPAWDNLGNQNVSSSVVATASSQIQTPDLSLLTSGDMAHHGGPTPEIEDLTQRPAVIFPATNVAAIISETADTPREPADLLCRDVGLGSFKTERRRISEGRRPSATTERVFGCLEDGRLVTAKYFPLDWPFDLDASIRIQTAFRTDGRFLVPEILAHGRVGDRQVLIEEQVPDGITLAQLVQSGEISLETGSELLSDVIRVGFHQPRDKGPSRCARERDQVFGALSRAPIPDSHRRRIQTWLQANYDLISHSPVDHQGDCIPANLLRSAGDDRWWLIDFDLAGTTSLAWQDHLRAERLTGWNLPGWHEIWGHPRSLALAFLSRLLEWNLQTKVTVDGIGATEHRFALAMAAERWADLLGPERFQAPDPTESPLASGSDITQVYWPIGGDWSETTSTRTIWPADGRQRNIDLSAPTPVDGLIRLDPASGPCVIHLDRLEFHSPNHHDHYLVSWERLQPGSETRLLEARDGSRWFLCFGDDPQILVQVAGGAFVDGVRFTGTKTSGIDPAMADRLIRESLITATEIAPLVKAREDETEARILELRGQIRDLHRRLAEGPAPEVDQLVVEAIKPKDVDHVLPQLMLRAEALESSLLPALQAARAAGESWALRLVESQARVQSLSDELAAARQAAVDVAAARNEILEARRQVEDERRHLQESQTELARARILREALGQEVAILRQAKEATTNELESLRQRVISFAEREQHWTQSQISLEARLIAAETRELTLREQAAQIEVEKGRLSAEVAEVRTRIVEANERTGHLTRENVELRERQLQNAAENQEQRLRLESLHRELGTAQAEQNRLRQTVEDHRVRDAIEAQELTQIRARNDHLGQQFAQAQSDCQHARQERDQSVLDCKQATRIQTELQGNLIRVESTLAERSGLLAQVEAQLSQQRDEVARLLPALAAWETTGNEQARDLAELHMKVDQLQRERQDAFHRLTETATKLAERDAQHAVIQAQFEQARIALRDLQTERDAFSGLNSQLRMQYERSESNLASCREELVQVRLEQTRSDANFQAVKAVSEENQKKFDRTVLEMEALQAELASAQITTAKLQEELIHKTALVAQLQSRTADAEFQAGQHNAALQEVRLKVERLESDLASLSTTAAEIHLRASRAEDHLVQANEVVRQGQSRGDRLQAERDVLAVQIQEARQELDRVRSEQRHTEESLREALRSGERSESQVGHLQRDLSDRTEQLIRSQQSLDHLTSELTTVQDRLARREATDEEIHRQSATLASDLRISRDALLAAVGRETELRALIQQREREIAGLISERESLMSKLSDLKIDSVKAQSALVEVDKRLQAQQLQLNRLLPVTTHWFLKRFVQSP